MLEFFPKDVLGSGLAGSFVGFFFGAATARRGRQDVMLGSWSWQFPSLEVPLVRHRIGNQRPRVHDRSHFEDVAILRCTTLGLQAVTFAADLRGGLPSSGDTFSDRPAAFRETSRFQLALFRQSSGSGIMLRKSTGFGSPLSSKMAISLLGAFCPPRTRTGASLAGAT